MASIWEGDNRVTSENGRSINGLRKPLVSAVSVFSERKTFTRLVIPSNLCKPVSK